MLFGRHYRLETSYVCNLKRVCIVIIFFFIDDLLSQRCGAVVNGEEIIFGEPEPYRYRYLASFAPVFL